MKLNIRVWMVGLVLLSNLAWADNLPFKVSVSKASGGNSSYIWQYKIVSREADLIIQSLSVNRDNCRINEEFRSEYEKRKELHLRRERMLDRLHGKDRPNKKAFTEKMPEYYRKLNFGETFLFSVTTNARFTYCNPMELTVGTNQGSYTLSWDD
ncbi:hypothetical protein [Providencia stuartii]|uniref:hypothetical protein n=1 Tax=Providencia stuartii TaxID=588 RepID=UPI00111DE347